MSSDDDFQPGKADLESDFDDGPGSPFSSSSFEVISVKRKPASGKATKRSAARAPSKSVKKPRKSVTEAIGDIEDGGYINRDHGYSWHDTEDVEGSAASLLDWFESVRERRGMPWRKQYDPSLTDEEKAQRAYEIWVSEVMLQQTQVTTVIAYWNRWVEKWPTIADLAKADIEEVNAVWRGLGYYRRASSLLNGAKKIVRDSKQDGRLSEDPVYLEKNVDGIGRYTAGAITSMAYGVRTPTVDGNIHRVLSRLLAYHATFGDKRSTDFLWSRATRIVNSLPRGADNEGIAGDWNQALMELGNQICKPVSPNCTECPVQKACHAYAELSAKPKSVKFDDVCDHCEPMPGKGNLIPSVTVFPMKKAKKASRDEDELVCIVETEGDERKWLFTKRPEKGLLAGLFQPPTLAIEAESTPAERLDLATGLIAETLNVEQSTISKSITSHKFHEPVKHIFSHINMTYHVLHLVLAKGDTIKASGQSVWWTAEEVESGNVGTGVKKCWAEVYGKWGSFEAGGATKPAAAKKTVKKRTSKVDLKAKLEPGEKLVKKVMMPMMPSRGGT